MTLYINKEKECGLSCQERYDIINTACRMADDNGFMNSYVFERALYCCAAMYIYEDKKEQFLQELESGKNILQLWSELLKDGTINELKANYANELDLLSDESQIWFYEYTEYAHSARGLLDAFQSASEQMVHGAADQLIETAQDSDIQKAIQIADKWGMNNNPKLEA